MAQTNENLFLVAESTNFPMKNLRLNKVDMPELVRRSDHHLAQEKTREFATVLKIPVF